MGWRDNRAPKRIQATQEQQCGYACIQARLISTNPGCMEEAWEYGLPRGTCFPRAHAAHRRPPLLLSAASRSIIRRHLARMSAVHVESSDTMRSRRAQCEAPPDNRETGGTYHSRGRSCAGEKIEHQNLYKRHSHHPPPRRPPPTRQQAILLLGGIVRVSLLAVVAAAAACCSYCDNEHPPPSNEARAIRRGARRALSAQLAGRVVRVSIGRVDGAYCMSKYPTCFDESS